MTLDAESEALIGLPTRKSRHPVANLPRGASADPGLLSVKKRAAAAQAEKLELHNARVRGELVPAAAVEREWSAVLADVRAAMLALPSRIGSRLPALSGHDIGVIEREIRDALREAARDDA